MKKSARVTTADEGEEIGSGRSSFKSPRLSKKSKLSDRTRAQGRGESGSDNGEKSRILLGHGFDKNVAAPCLTEVKERKDLEQRRRLVLDTGRRGWLIEAVLQVVFFLKQRFQWRSPWSCPLVKGRTWYAGWGRKQR